MGASTHPLTFFQTPEIRLRLNYSFLGLNKQLFFYDFLFRQAVYPSSHTHLHIPIIPYPSSHTYHLIPTFPYPSSHTHRFIPIIPYPSSHNYHPIPIIQYPFSFTHYSIPIIKHKIIFSLFVSCKIFFT